MQDRPDASLGRTEGESMSVADTLASLRRGEPGALDRLVSLLYDDIRRIARERMSAEREGHTLGATALVHEAYLRLSTQRRLTPTDRSEFFAAASKTMRRILVDPATTPSRADAKLGLGRVYLHEGHRAEALRLFREADAFWQGFDRSSRWATEAARYLADAAAGC